MYLVFRVVFFIMVVLLPSFPTALSSGPDLGSELKKLGNEDRDLLQEKGSSINKEVQKVQVVIDDFLVNDDTLGGNEQYGASVDRAKSGNFVITWIDRRYGNRDIYAQRYDSSGIPQGSNFKVNGDIGIAIQTSPAVAMDSPGGFVITWEDGRSGSDIYAQRYDSSGIPIGSNFKVNDGSQYVARGSPAVAMNNSGNFVITWKFTPSSDDIYAQRFHHSGTRLGNNFKVNDDSGPASQSEADVAIDGSGNFVIVWRDARNPYENFDIYAQRYDCAGNALGSNFMVNDDSGNTLKAAPHIDMNDSGYCIITWYECCSRTWAQRYSPNGSPLGNNFLVPSDAEFPDQGNPDVAIDESGDFIIAWQSIQPSPYQWNIHAQRYAFTGIPIDSNLNVNDDSSITFPRNPTIATDSSGNFAVTWEDDRNVQSDIYVQMYYSSGTTAGSNFKANDDIGSADQLYPSIALDNFGNFIITWIDLRNGSSYRGIEWENSDIYAQRCDPSGIRIGSNFKVNDVSGSAELSPPTIATTGSGNSVIAWEDNRNGHQDIYAQRYDSAGAPLGSNFKVHAGDWYLQFPAVAMNSCGSFVITWQVSGPYHYYFFYIYAQRFDSSGTFLGSSFRVDAGVGTAEFSTPAIAMDESGNFAITWESGSSDIYAQRYDSSGITLGSAFKVNASDGWVDQHNPAISMDTLGNFVITWEDETNGNFDIYAQRYDSSGSPLGSNFKVNDDLGTAPQQNPAIAMDGASNFVIIWEDYRNGLSKPTLYAQRYDSDGNPIGNNYLVPNYQYANFAQRYPTVTSNSSNIYFGWMDNRRAKGWDIYAKVVDWNWTKVEEDEEVTLPNAFELYQNYPNPFNPTTTIRFTVEGQRRPIRTTLKIHNILGQKMRTLVDELKRAGSYEVIWDGKDDRGKEVASGIYFYQLKAGDFIETKKMLLLR
jgi:hypothetical protein